VYLKVLGEIEGIQPRLYKGTEYKRGEIPKVEVFPTPMTKFRRNIVMRQMWQVPTVIKWKDRIELLTDSNYEVWMENREGMPIAFQYCDVHKSQCRVIRMKGGLIIDSVCYRTYQGKNTHWSGPLLDLKQRGLISWNLTDCTCHSDRYHLGFEVNELDNSKKKLIVPGACMYGRVFRDQMLILQTQFYSLYTCHGTKWVRNQ